jgi:hypothetical protein
MTLGLKTGRDRRRRTAGLLLGAALIGWGAGCSALGFLGAMEESRRRHSTRTVEGEYAGLKDRQWAVVVIADRYIEGEYPQIVPYLTAKITDQLSDPKAQEKIGAKGRIPGLALLKYLYEHPRWTAMPRSELAKQLGVDRLIVIELLEYRLNEPGNQYVWNGEATGTLGVCEADGPAPDEYAFQKAIKVTFPDKDGMGPNDLSSEAVATELARRFADRCAWLFYAHPEPYYPKY